MSQVMTSFFSDYRIGACHEFHVLVTLRHGPFCARNKKLAKKNQKKS